MRLIVGDDAALDRRRPRHSRGSRAASLEVALAPQQRSNWCWAAIAAGLGRFHATSDGDQAALAAALLGSAAGDAPDVAARLLDALRIAGCLDRWTPGRPAAASIAAAIDRRRPLAARIGWAGGAAHFVLIHGYADGPDGFEIAVADPRGGRSTHRLADFPRHYRGRRGCWHETYWTRPATAVADRRVKEGG